MQQIVGTLLYFAGEVKPTMLVSLGSIDANQDKINNKINNPLNNCYINVPPTKMTLYATRKVTQCSYLLKWHSCIRDGGHLFLGYQIFDPSENNGAIIIIS